MGKSNNPNLTFSSFVNCFNNLVGAGIVSLPATLAKTGLGLGTGVLLLIAIATAITSKLIISTCAKNGIKSPRALSVSAFGRVGGFVVDLATFLFCLGSLIVYITLAGEYLQTIVEAKVAADKIPTWIFSNGGAFVKALIVVFLIPFLIPTSLHALRHISFVVVIAALYTVALVIYTTFTTPIKDVDYIRTDMNSFEAVGVVVFAFGLNYATPLLLSGIDETLNPKSVSKKLTSGAVASVVIVGILYISIAICGYLTYGAGINGNVLKNIGANDIPGLVANVAMCIVVIFSFPILCIPTRVALIKILTPRSDKDIMAKENFKIVPYLISGYVLLAGAYIFSVLVPQIDTILSIFGGICGSLCCFVIPVFCYVKLSYKNTIIDPAVGGSFKQWCRDHVAVLIFIAIFTVIFFVFGSIGSVMSAISLAKS